MARGRPSPSERPRRGFGLIEALVALTVLAILAAVLLPATAAFAAADRVTRSISDLGRVEAALAEFTLDVDQCAGNLEQLVFPIDGADLDIFGGGYNPAAQGRWVGPYFHLALPAAGPVTGVGTITGLRLVETTPDDIPGIVVAGDLFDAAALDRAVDSGDGAAAGLVRWTIVSGNQVEIEYYLALTCPVGPGPGGGPPGGGPP